MWSRCLNEPGLVYFVVLLGGKSSPSATEVMGGTDGGGGAAITTGTINLTAASVSDSVTITHDDILPGTIYDVWCVAKVCGRAGVCILHVTGVWLGCVANVVPCPSPAVAVLVCTRMCWATHKSARCA